MLCLMQTILGIISYFRRAFPAKQDLKTAVAKSPADRCQLAQPGSDRRIVRSPAAITDRTAIGADDLARPPLAHLVVLAERSRGLSSGDGRHHFFEAMSFSMTFRASHQQATASAGVLVLKRPKPARVRDVEPAKLRLSLVERRAADVVLAAHIPCCCPRSLLPQESR